MAPGGTMRTSPLSQSEEAAVPVLPSRPRATRSRGRALSVRLSPDLEERLRERLVETGLKQGEGIAVLLDFALELEAELRDLEPELSWYAANRSVPIARAVVQLAARSLGIEPVEVYAPMTGRA